MTPRFDEVELRKDPLAELDEAPKEVVLPSGVPSGRIRRFLAALIDLSIFAALALALSPLVSFNSPAGDRSIEEWTALAGLTLFVLLLSFYYFVGCWIFWGKTVGGTICETKVVSEDYGRVPLRRAIARWGGTILSLITLGLGFFIAALPGARSLPDRMSATLVVYDGRSTQRDGNH